MTPEQIALQLQEGPDLLQTRLRDLPERHRSVDALFDQSWALLSATEQAVWMRLAVFRGGFDGAAIATVTGADLPTLLGLVDKSLVRADGSGRYDLHPLAHHYAAARLAAADATAEARQRHADYYFGFLQQAEDQMQEPERKRWHNRIDAEYANIRAAWQWALDEERWTALWPVVRPLFDFWMRRGSWADGIDLLLPTVQRAPPDDASGYAHALIAVAVLLARTGGVAEALPYEEEGYRRAVLTGEPVTIAMAEMHRGMLVANAPVRERHFQSALTACRHANNRPLLANVLLLYGDVLREQGALERVHAVYTECLTHARALDDELAVYALGNLGRLALLDSDIEQAYTRFGECVALARAQANPVALADWLLRLGGVQVYQHDPAAAHATLTECVGLAKDLNHQRCLTNARVWLAAATIEQGDTTAAGQLLHLSLAEYATRLHGPASAHPSAADLVEALVVAAQICAAQRQGEKAAVVLGCADALRAEAQTPADPFLITMADDLREHLARTMDPAILYNALARGRDTPARACLPWQIRQTNGTVHNPNIGEQ